MSPTVPSSSQSVKNLATLIRSLEDLRRAVSARQADLVWAGAVGLGTEVDEEVLVERVTAVRLAGELRDPALQVGIELVVPARVERVGDVHPLPVQGVLEHLRAAGEGAAGLGMAAVPAEQSAHPHL